MTKVTIKTMHDGSFEFELEDDEVLPFVRMAAEMESHEISKLHEGWTADDLDTNPDAEGQVYLTAKGKETVKNGA